ncbi:MAG: FG-GAP repeat protein, partial [Phycisphaerales bacterium]|nr:FG-GAP repeat protein [Phycisphaerales bacterium]
MVTRMLAVLTLATSCNGLMGQTVDDFLAEQRVVASEGATGDQFGYSVSISGDTMVVGVPGDNDNGSLSGSAYIFERNGNGAFSQVEKLVAKDGEAGDHFGTSVSISGDLVVVGAYLDSPKGENSGSAYIFERDGNGAFSQVEKLVPNDGASDDFFGSSVFISGETVVVGMTGDSDNGANSGSAYIFERNGNGAFSQVEKLVPSDGASGDHFGWSVSISGETV